MKKVINIFNFLILALFIFLIVFTPAIFAYSYVFFSEQDYNTIYKNFNYFTLFIIFILLIRNFSLIILNSKFITNNYIKNLFQQCLFSAKYRWIGFIIFLILDIIVILINEIIIKIDFFRFIFFFLYYAFSPAYLLFLLFSSKNNLNIVEKTICLLFINLFNNIILLFVTMLWSLLGFDP